MKNCLGDNIGSLEGFIQNKNTVILVDYGKRLDELCAEKEFVIGHIFLTLKMKTRAHVQKSKHGRG